MQTLNLRRALKSDLPTVVSYNIALALESEQLALTPSKVEAGVKRAFENENHGRYYVATTNEKIVGQLMLTWEWSDWRNGMWWWIQSVYVHPEFRQQGVFKTLYDFVKQQAQKEGAIGLRLYVFHSNEKAQSTYARLGMHDPQYKIMEEEF